MSIKTDLVDRLQSKLKQLFETAWEGRINLADVERWVQQFDSHPSIEDDEQLHALFLLTHFIYFGQQEIRELLKSLYRDLYRTPLLHHIRRQNANTTDRVFIEAEFAEARRKTRFLGVGNPSESGVHLLYLFRQENRLPRTMFMNTHEIFSREISGGILQTAIADDQIQHYIFIDDLCGSGTQASIYCKDLVEPLKSQIPSIKVDYYVLFATNKGLDAVRNLAGFDNVKAVFELDESFKAFSTTSRIFGGLPPPFELSKVQATCKKYGDIIAPTHPLGYKDGQLLVGFNYNTPDNTLPIIWGDDMIGAAWTPIFRRYNKVYV